jgi:hypothetical protein
MNNCFVLPEESDVADLLRYLERAVKLDPNGAVRFRAYGDVLTVFVAPVYSGNLIEGSPLILGLRTMRLAENAEFDLCVSIARTIQKLRGETVEDFSLSKKLGRFTKGETPNQICLGDEIIDVEWSRETPTRSGWELGGSFQEQQLTEIARNGVAKITESLPTSVGGPIAAKVRAEIWGGAFDYKYPIPMGAAFVAAGLGFLTEGETVQWFTSGHWVRLSAEHGHVLTHFARDYVSING